MGKVPHEIGQSPLEGGGRASRGWMGRCLPKLINHSPGVGRMFSQGVEWVGVSLGSLITLPGGQRIPSGVALGRCLSLSITPWGWGRIPHGVGKCPTRLVNDPSGVWKPLD